MGTPKTKLVVIDENTLAYICPATPRNFTVLRALITKGSRWANYNDTVNFSLPANTTMRPATAQDFNYFRVSFEGYNNPSEYEFN